MSWVVDDDDGWIYSCSPLGLQFNDMDGDAGTGCNACAEYSSALSPCAWCPPDAVSDAEAPPSYDKNIGFCFKAMYINSACPNHENALIFTYPEESNPDFDSCPAIGFVHTYYFVLLLVFGILFLLLACCRGFMHCMSMKARNRKKEAEEIWEKNEEARKEGKRYDTTIDMGLCGIRANVQKNANGQLKIGSFLVDNGGLDCGITSGVTINRVNIGLQHISPQGYSTGTNNTNGVNTQNMYQQRMMINQQMMQMQAMQAYVQEQQRLGKSPQELFSQMQQFGMAMNQQRAMQAQQYTSINQQQPLQRQAAANQTQHQHELDEFKRQHDEQLREHDLAEAQMRQQLADMQSQMESLQSDLTAQQRQSNPKPKFTFGYDTSNASGTGTTIGQGVEYNSQNDAVLAGMPDLSAYYPPMPTLNADSPYNPNNLADELDI